MQRNAQEAEQVSRARIEELEGIVQKKERGLQECKIAMAKMETASVQSALRVQTVEEKLKRYEVPWPVCFSTTVMVSCRNCWSFTGRGFQKWKQLNQWISQ